MQTQHKNLPLNLILSCLALVEQYIPKYEEMLCYTPSADFNPYDSRSLHYEAERMMGFVGLRDIKVTISYVMTEESRAGDISLNDKKEICININSNILMRGKSKQLVLAILAHEICHKLLYMRGLVMSDTMRNEICTDLATIYVGFGLLTIHGCIEEKTKYISYNTVSTEIYRVGYLTPRSYILAYIIVARSFGLMDSQLGIVPDGEFLKQQFNLAKKDAIKFKTYSYDDVKKLFVEQSKTIARNKRNIIILQYLLKRMEKEMESCYKQLDSRFNRLILGDGGLVTNPIAALYAMRSKPEIVANAPNDRKISRITKKIYKCLKYVDKEELENTTRFIACPMCGQKSNIALNENCCSIQKCKNCGKMFYWDASLYHENMSFLGRIKHFFKSCRKKLKR